MYSNSVSAIIFLTFKSFYKIGSSSGKNISGTVKDMIKIHEFLGKNSQQFQLTVLVKICNLLSVYELLEKMMKTEGKHVTRHYWLSIKFQRKMCKKLFTNMSTNTLLCLFLRYPWNPNPGYFKSIVRSSKCWCAKGSGKRICARITEILLKMPKTDFKLKCWKWQTHTQAPTYTEQAFVLWTAKLISRKAQKPVFIVNAHPILLQGILWCHPVQRKHKTNLKRNYFLPAIWTYPRGNQRVN